MGLILAMVVSGVYITLILVLLTDWNSIMIVGTTALILAISYLVSLTSVAEKYTAWTMKVHYLEDLDNYEVCNRIANALSYMPPEKVPQKIRWGVIQNDAPNAFAIGASTVAFTTAILSQASDEELAGVMAHELGHLHYRDSQRLSAAVFIATPGVWAANALNWLMIALVNIMQVLGPVGLVFRPIYWAFVYFTRAAWWLVNMAVMKNSRDSEFRADDYAAGLSLAAHRGLISFLARLPNSPSKGWLASLQETHPTPTERVERLQARLNN